MCARNEQDQRPPVLQLVSFLLCGLKVVVSVVSSIVANLAWRRTSGLVHGTKAPDANVPGVATSLTAHEHVAIVKSSTNSVPCSASDLSAPSSA